MTSKALKLVPSQPSAHGTVMMARTCTCVVCKAATQARAEARGQ